MKPENKSLLHALLSFILTISACKNDNVFFVEGVVKSKEMGKDGYTAIIVNAEGKEYDAVISRVNLANTAEYQDLAPGDNVTVYGDTMHLGDRINVKVTAIKK